MRIIFDEKGRNFIDFYQKDGGKIAVVLSSEDVENPRKTIVNSVELTRDQVRSLLKDVSLETERKDNEN